MVKLEHETDGAIPQLAQLGLVPAVDGLTPDYYIAARRFVQCSEHVHQRALPRAAGADDGDHLTAWDRKIDACEHVELVSIAADVGFMNVVSLQHRHRHSCLMASIG